MNSSKESVRVVIFGVEYSIKGDVDIETTKKVARYVDSKMVEIHEHSAPRDSNKVAVLAALNIAGEFFEIKTKGKASVEKMNEVQRRITTLSQKINSIL
jgi:cell division protein ZapA